MEWVVAMPWDDQVKQRVKLRDLNILMAVANAGSMGKAAARLNLSQPSVSKGIADLESIIGVRLLHRGPQGTELTSSGQALIHRSIVIFDELRRGVEEIDFLADPTSGEIRLGTTDPIATAIVWPAIERLSRRYPGMTFRVIVADTGILYRELATRTIEFLISRTTEPVPEQYCSETLFHDSLAVVTGANNPLTRRRKIELSELLNERWAMAPFDSYFGSIVSAAFRQAGLQPPKLTIATNSLGLRNELLSLAVI